MPIKLKPAEPRKPLLERAFELARSGRFPDVAQLERALGEEGYLKTSPHWNSPSLRRQLRTECLRSTASRTDAPTGTERDAIPA